MNTYSSKKYLLSFAFTCFVLATPTLSYAAIVTAGTPVRSVEVGDTIKIPIILDTEGKEINAVDGSLTLSGDYTLLSLPTDGSVFTLWPLKPSFSSSTITFTGGTPSGVFGSNIHMFSIILKATKKGVLRVTPNTVHVYLNDGKGTPFIATRKNLEVPVSKSNREPVNELAISILSDKTAPEPFAIDIGNDPTLFNGQYFASFYTSDAQSGINRYEVTENSLDPIRSGSPYILRDQSRTGTLTVHAIDNAGNIRTESINLSTKKPITPSNHSMLIIIALIVCSAIGIRTVVRYYRIKHEAH